MRKLFYATLLVCVAAVAGAQDGSHSTVNRLPDFIPPTPEAASILKADQLTVGYVTGSPNISIPLGILQTGKYSLPITLNYSSTGVKVDEYASMVGMGWNLNYGGVVSRSVMGEPDENRTQGNNNLTGVNFNVQDAALANFLYNANDKESDIFTFSFPGGGGKFILDTNYQPVQLSRQNLKIQVISSSFQNGFIITTDNGTAYHFEDYEISTSRNPTGNGCSKTNDLTSVRTSWYLTKIVLPSTQKQINFTYTTASITFQSSITQTISRVTASGTYECPHEDGEPTGPTGNACPIGSEQFSTCISQQTVTSKFITKIETSDGDKVEFTYDGTSRTDLENGKRLSLLKITNRNGLKIREVTFNATYQSASGSAPYLNKRMFLNSMDIRGGEISTVSGPLTYTFSYLSPGSLPSRLSYAQDWYGYYNGQTTNASLIPKLTSSDINYSTYSVGGNGNGSTSVVFGDRSIDTAYSSRGLLKKIEYPTGGYDSLIYAANRYFNTTTSTELLAGGHSIAKIISYTDEGIKALEREFIYRHKSDNKASAFLLNDNLKFSVSNLVRRDGYTCQTLFPSPAYCYGPTCTYAVVTSNSNNPISAFGGQHLYYRSVLEITKGQSSDNGMVEHLYSFFNNLGPLHRLGNNILNCPYQIVPDIVIGEYFTGVYKNTGSAYDLVNTTEKKLRIDGLDEFSNFSVKRNYMFICTSSSLPSSAEFDAFDVDEYYINLFTVVTDTIIEKEYADGSLVMTKLTKFDYANNAYTYATRTTTTGSDGLEVKVERKYPPDYSGYNFMTTRNIISPTVEEKQFKNSNLVSTLTTKFKDWYSNATVIAPDTTDLKFGSSTKVQRILYHGYDTHGNVNEVSKESDERFSYIWDYNKNFAIAKVQNASASAIAYTSFEADGTGGWTLSGNVLKTGGLTGHQSFNGTVSKTVSSGNYIVTLWSKTSASISVNSTSGTLLHTIGSWKLLEWNLSSVTSVSVVGTEFDEVRLYPKGAFMTTFCYEPLLGLTSQCDVNNRLNYYEYDGMGRLLLVRDQDKNILKKLCYNYAGQPEACDVYYNEQKIDSVTRNNCGPDSIGSKVYYTVPAGKYSGYSLADANAKALQEIAAMGQANANSKGTCTLLCTTGNCTGQGRKCVYNVCETGLKIHTSIQQLGPHYWRCTFHYEFSDGSWSQNYTEDSTVMCMDEL